MALSAFGHLFPAILHNMLTGNEHDSEDATVQGDDHVSSQEEDRGIEFAARHF